MNSENSSFFGSNRSLSRVHCTHVQEILDYYKLKTKKNKTGYIYEFGAYARLTDSREASFKVEAPQVSSFSARGPVYANTVTSVIADVLKPDILAPGNQIWGAWSPAGIDMNGYSGKTPKLILRIESTSESLWVTAGSQPPISSSPDLDIQHTTTQPRECSACVTFIYHRLI